MLCQVLRTLGIVMLLAAVAALSACGSGTQQTNPSPLASPSGHWQRIDGVRIGSDDLGGIVGPLRFTGADVRILVTTTGDLGGKKNRRFSVMPRYPMSVLPAATSSPRPQDLRGMAWALPDSGRSEYVGSFPPGDWELVVNKGLGYAAEVSLFRQQ